MTKFNQLIAFVLLGNSLFGQTTYSKEVEAQIAAVENGLVGRVIIQNEGASNLLERMKYYKVKGLSIAVVHNYQIVWAKGYGWANEVEKRPVTTQTLFEPGSISKSLNAVGVLKLVQDNKLDLNKDINDYLTSWKFPYDSLSKNKKITLAHLLSHSAGLTVHGFPGYDYLEIKPTLPQILDGKAPANTSPVRSLFEPGLKFKYSGGGTTISQLIVSDVTKRPYDQFLYESVLKPIGMENSFYNQPPEKEKIPFCASGYYSDGSPVHYKFHVYPEQAAAGLWMTPTDLCHYIIETQLAYEGKSSKVLNQEMTKLRLTPYNDRSAALGVFIENRNGAMYFQHGAANEGFCGIYYGSLKGGNGVAIFLNSSNSAIIQEILNSIATVYKWENFYYPVYKQSISVPDSILKTYSGVYMFDGKWASIYEKDSTWFYYSDGIQSKMYFNTADEFYNKEFSSEKKFIKDSTGIITGFLRRSANQNFPSAVKITKVDTLQMNKEDMNGIAWHLIEIKNFNKSQLFLQRALQLNPGDLILMGNLAHCYLFTGNYEKAISVYRAHLRESIEGSYTWDKMIQDDFLYFKRNGFDKSLLDKVLSDLKLSPPEGF